MKKLVIIGSGSGGLPVASMIAKARKNLYDITVITTDTDIAYSPCGIPYVLKGDIPSYKKLVMQTIEHYRQLGINIITKTTVEKIDTHKQKVQLNKTWLDYDYLVIATGTTQKLPQIKGTQLKGVFSAHIKTLAEGEQFDKHVSKQKPLQTIITGSGSIDLEIAIALAQRRHTVTVVEKEDHLMPDRLDKDMSEYVTSYLQEKNIKVYTGKKLLEITGTDKAEYAKFNNMTLPADIILLGTDFLPETTLAKKTGLDVDENGIIVDEKSRVSRNGNVLRNVFASGACANMVNTATNKKDFMVFGATSIQRARTVAEQLLGKKTSINKSTNPRIALLSDLHIGAVGLTTQEAKQQELEIISSFVKGKNTARYYPGGAPIYLKLLFEKNTQKLIGAQIISTEKGVKERIDALSIAIKCKITAEELSHTETAYTPPVSPLIDVMVEAANKAWYLS